jgi:hypothetical protein
MVNRTSRRARNVKKSTSEYRILEKKNGRFSVEARGGEQVNGFAKDEILFKEGFLKTAPNPAHYNITVAAAPVAAEAPAAEEKSAA